MDGLNRRAALAGATGAGLSALFGLPQHAEGAGPGDVTELLVIGPFKLGDWFDKSEAQFDSKLGFGVKLGLAARDAMIKSFNECLVYVIDQRIRPKDGPVRFDTDNNPRIALTGPFHHEWKDGKKQLVVQIASVEPISLATHNDKPTPTRAFSVVFSLKTEMEDENAHTRSTRNFSKEQVAYDIKGTKR